MDPLQELREIEAIKQLKYRYMRSIDQKDWELMRRCFTPDATTSYSGGKYAFEGIDAIMKFMTESMDRKSFLSSHRVHHPEIALESETSATGIWALEDFVRFVPGLDMRGYGHYHETYEKEDGRWRIKSSKLTRLREDIVTPLFSVYVSDRIRRLLAIAARSRID